MGWATLIFKKNSEMCRPRLELLIGPMFSGKSTALTHRIERYRLSKQRCVVLKWSEDVREKETVETLMTHGGYKVACIRVQRLMDFVPNYDKYDVIGIDDAQFFKDIERFCDLVVDIGKKTVIAAGLDADFRRNPFPNIINLIPKAEKVKKFSAICVLCGTKAYFSAKLSKYKFNECDVIDVGGEEKYTVLCRQCYLKEHKN